MTIHNPDRDCADCGKPATQRVTVLIDYATLRIDHQLDSQSYCTQCAANIVEQIAHFEPANVELVSVIAITDAWLWARSQ